MDKTGGLNKQTNCDYEAKNYPPMFKKKGGLI